MDTVDDFDDMGAMRRKVCAIEQEKADLGIAIGVLKQERARLWLGLEKMVSVMPTQGPTGSNLRYIEEGREVLKQVRIDK
jgi:hypothetical protein